MITKKSRWSDPAIIIAALAVLNGGFWQYRAMGRADEGAALAAQATLAKQVADTAAALNNLQYRVEVNKNEIDARLDRLERRR